MRILNLEKAVFGQVNQGHGLRSYTSNKEFFQKISPFLDLPDAIPPGINPFPYISGFPMENYYVIARILLDTRASRSGMVLAYALAVPIEEVTKLKNINHLLDLLPSRLEDEESFVDQSIALDCSLDKVENNDEVDSLIAELFVKRDDKPIIYVGINGFEDIVASAWKMLWPDMKKVFVFRLSFSPKDCVAPVFPNLVCIPESLVIRWNGFEKKIDQTKRVTTVSNEAKILLSSCDAYKDLCDKFGIEIKKPAMLGLLYQAKEEYESLSNFSSCLKLIRIIEVLSSGSMLGNNSKRELVQNLADLITESEIGDILKLRNLQGNSFNDFQIVWNAIEVLLGNHCFIEKDDSVMIDIIKNVFNAEMEISNGWQKAVQSGIFLAFKNPKYTIHSAIWRWLDLSPNLTIILLNYVDITYDSERLLVMYAPTTISTEITQLLLPVLVRQNLLTLHGLLLGISYPVAEGLQCQLKIDTNQLFTQGLEAFVNKANPLELLQACSNVSDQRAIEAVSIRASKEISILKTVSSTLDISLVIWRKALTLNKEVWQAPKDAQKILFSLLEEYLTSGESPYIDLIDQLSNTPLADLCEFENRKTVWKLSNKFRGNFLKQTALGWFNRVLDLDIIDLDMELEKAVYEIPSLNEKMKNGAINNAGGILEVFVRIKYFSEKDFLEWLDFWLDNCLQEIELDIDSLGRLINQKQWKKAAKTILFRSKSSPLSLNRALDICKGQLSIWDRLTIGNTYDNEKWDALLDLASSLYGTPQDQDLWVRSGGKERDLWVWGSGLNSWSRAINKVKNGGGPIPQKLLDAMKEDFPNNNKLDILCVLFKGLP